MSRSNLVYCDPPHIGNLCLGASVLDAGVYRMEWDSCGGSGCVWVDEAVWCAAKPDWVTVFRTEGFLGGSEMVTGWERGVPFVMLTIEPRHAGDSFRGFVAIAPSLSPGKPVPLRVGKERRTYHTVPLEFTGKAVVLPKSAPQVQAYRPSGDEREFPLEHGSALQLSCAYDNRYVLDVLCVADPSLMGMDRDSCVEMLYPGCWSLAKNLEATGPDFFRFAEGKEPSSGSLICAIYATEPDCRDDEGE